MNSTTNTKIAGIEIVEKVVKELHSLIWDYHFSIVKNTIINITELLKEEYEKDLENFKMITTKIGLMVINIQKQETESYSEEVEKLKYSLVIFGDNQISNLDQINLNDVLGLSGDDLSKYKYLSKCTFHFNRLYKKDQFDMIPGIIKDIII